MLEKEQGRKKKGGRRRRRREGGSSGRPSVVCEYDYISIDACIVQFGERGGRPGVATTGVTQLPPLTWSSPVVA